MKNITTYHTELPSIDVIEGLLAESPDLFYRECPEMNMYSYGFATTKPVIKLENGFRIDFTFEQKKIPVKIINRELAKVVANHERASGIKLPKKERMQIKEVVIAALCKRALSEVIFYSAFYHEKTGYLIVDTSNKIQSSAFMSCLNKLIGSIKTTTLHVCGVSNGLREAALECIKDGHLRVAGFDFGEKLNLQSVEDKTKHIKFSTDYILDHIQELLCSGYQIESLSLHRDGVTFTLTSDFKIKGIKETEEVEPPEFDSKEEEEDWALHKQTVLLELMASNIGSLVNHFDKLAEEDQPIAA